jgi:hypothetical protein
MSRRQVELTQRDGLKGKRISKEEDVHSEHKSVDKSRDGLFGYWGRECILVDRSYRSEACVVYS